MSNSPGFKDESVDSNRHEIDWSVREELSDWIRSVRLEKGEIIIDQSSVPEYAYILQNGLLGLYRRLSPSKSVLVGTVRSGESVGMSQLMYSRPFPADLSPIQESIVLRGDRDDFQSLRDNHPDAVSDALLKETNLFTAMYDRIEAQLSEKVNQRIARQLLELSKDIGRSEPDGIKLLTRLSRKDLSQMVGCTHESASRSMSDLETKGIIETRHKYITIKSPNRLRSLVDGS